MQKVYNFPVIIEKDEDGYFVGIVPHFKGCHTQAKDLNTLYKRLQEAIELCIEVETKKSGRKEISQNEFIGFYNLHIPVMQ